MKKFLLIDYIQLNQGLQSKERHVRLKNSQATSGFPNTVVKNVCFWHKFSEVNDSL